MKPSKLPMPNPHTCEGSAIQPEQDLNRYLEEQPVPRLLFQFSGPCVMSMLVSALYNIVDQIFIGQGVGYLGNAATNVVIGCVATLLFEACPLSIVRLFGSEDGLYKTYACLCFRIFLGAILFTCIQKASSIFLQSMGRPAKATVLSLARDVVFFIPALLLLAPVVGVEGMLWAAPIADGLSLLLAVALVGTELRKFSHVPACGSEKASHSSSPDIAKSPVAIVAEQSKQ